MKWLKRIFNKQTGVDTHTSHVQQPVSEPTLVGRIARAVTPLRNAGFVELDGLRHEVVSDKGYVQSGAYVRITGNRMGWLTVEPVDLDKSSVA